MRVYLVLLALTVLLPAWGVAGLAAWHLARAQRYAVVAEGREAARAVATAMEREVAALRASLTALATSPALAAGDLGVFHRQATELQAALGAPLMLIAPDGRPLVDTRLPFGQPLTPGEVSTEIAAAAAAVAGPAGVPPVLVSDLHRAPGGGDGRPTLAVSLPVPPPSGGSPAAPAAILSVMADAAGFWSEALRRAALPPGWIAAVADRHSTILARHPEPEGFVGQPVHPDALAVLRAGAEEGWAPGGASRDGRPVHVAWRRIGALGWTVLVGVPAEVVEGAMRRSLLPVAIGGAAAVLALTLGLALWGARRLTAPLARLERAAAAAGRGAVPEPAPASGLREVDAAAAALVAAAAERRDREAEGAALAARLEAVLESTTDSVLVLDRDGRVTYANGRARTLLGRGRELLRLHAAEILPDCAGNCFVHAFERARREGRPESCTAHHAPLGLWIAADAYPSAEGVTVFLRDVTAARRAEAALRAGEARLHAVLDNIPVGVVLAEAPSARILLANRRAEEILGRPIPLGAAASAGRIEAFHPDGRPVTAGDYPVERTLATGAPASIELRQRRGDGGFRWIRSTSAPVRDAEGRLAGVVVALTDTSAEREAAASLQRQVAAEAAARQAAIAAAEALADSEERFRRFAEASPDVLWIGDPTGTRIDYVSPAVERIWGETRAALQADPGLWLTHVEPEDRARAAAAIPAAAEGGAAAGADTEYRLRRRPGGELRWIREIAFPMRDALGRVTRIGRFARDVTARKEAEQRQQLLMAELNHRVKNTLATVQSLAMQTARGGAGGGSEALDAFIADFQSRLLALARGHDLLTARTWAGAPLAEVAKAALAPWRTGGREARVLAEGPPVWLAPRQALGLALALHELATNAAKHGALTAEAGRVSLCWRHEEEDRVAMEWTEAGGPPVFPPSRRGFGTRLLERGLAAELGSDATVALRYERDGFGAVIRFRAPPRHASDDIAGAEGARGDKA